MPKSPQIAVLMLDTSFPRIPGDIGHPETFGFPIHYEVVTGAGVDAVLANDNSDHSLVSGFVDAAQKLETQGFKAITTSCGFLALVQPILSKSVSIPVLTSSLCLIPDLQKEVGRGKIAVITADSERLQDRHFAACGVEVLDNLVVVGLENAPNFRRVILEDTALGPDSYPKVEIEEEVIAACMDVHSSVGDLRAIVFECTNLAPFATRVHRTVGLPVYSINDGIRQLHHDLGNEDFKVT